MRGNGVRSGALVLFLKATSSHSPKDWALYGLGNLFLPFEATASLSPHNKGECSLQWTFHHGA